HPCPATRRLHRRGRGRPPDLEVQRSGPRGRRLPAGSGYAVADVPLDGAIAGVRRYGLIRSSETSSEMCGSTLTKPPAPWGTSTPKSRTWIVVAPATVS